MMKCKLNQDEKYLAQKYDLPGIYVNTDENGLEELMIVSHLTSMVYVIPSTGHSPYNLFKEIMSEVVSDLNMVRPQKPVVEEVSGKVSESFALKALAIALGRNSIPE